LWKNDGIIADIPEKMLLAKWEISEKNDNDCWTIAAVGDIGLSGKTALHIK